MFIKHGIPYMENGTGIALFCAMFSRGQAILMEKSKKSNDANGWNWLSNIRFCGTKIWRENMLKAKFLI